MEREGRAVSDIHEGDCYMAAWRVVISAEKSGNFSEVVLVHGFVDGVGKLKGHRFGHAWVELTVDDGLVIVADYSNGNRFHVERERYYRLGGIVEIESRRYDAFQAIALAFMSKDTGPWDEKTVDIEVELDQVKRKS